MSYSDLRKGRVSVVGQVYLLTTVTHDRRPWFGDFRAGCAVARVIHDLASGYPGLSLAWVVMPDHVHWLVQLPEGLTLARLMQRFKGRSALALNDCRGRPGTVWAPAYHDRALRREGDVRAAARYLVANPVRAGIVGRVGDYPLWDAVWL